MMWVGIWEGGFEGGAILILLGLCFYIRALVVFLHRCTLVVRCYTHSWLCLQTELEDSHLCCCMILLFFVVALCVTEVAHVCVKPPQAKSRFRSDNDCSPERNGHSKCQKMVLIELPDTGL